MKTANQKEGDAICAALNVETKTGTMSGAQLLNGPRPQQSNAAPSVRPASVAADTFKKFMLAFNAGIVQYCL